LKPPAFAYCAPDTEDEVLSLLREYGADAKLLAGGQSLMPLLNLRLVRPAVLVDLNRVRTLQYLTAADDHVRVGAMTRQQACERSAMVAARVPLLVDALRWVGHPQIRTRGTVGGSLAHADPAAELPAVAAALGASFVIAGPRGTRVLPPEEFFVSYLTTAVGPDELLREVRFPALPAWAGWAFLEVSRRRGDFALVGAAVVVALDGGGALSHARIALTGVGATPVRAVEAEACLAGRRPDDRALDEARAIVTARLSPPSDIHATAEYRRHAAGVLVARAARAAAERAQGARP